MLEVGNGSLSTAESRAHFSMWCIMASPLIAGNDIRSMSQTVKDILTNPEAIAVNQDAAGIQGTRVIDNGDLEVWCKPLGSANGSTKAVALLNRSGSAANITVNWSNIGLSGSANVRDLWAKADRGSYSGSYTANVPSHDVVMITIGGSAVGTPEPVQPTTAPVCNPVAIAPYIQVDGGTWQTVSSVTVSSGATVIIGPQPLTGGTWSWSGCGVSGATREVTIYPTSTCTITATYTNDCGATSTQSFTITVSGSTVTKGDVNSNGAIDIVDALLVAQYYVGLNPANFNSAAADVNCSGAIDIVDALLVAQRYVGLITSFPC
jgi:alpha-galactosidase